MANRTLRILQIDSSKASYEATRRELALNIQDDHFDFALEWRDCLRQGIEAMSQNTFDAVLLELDSSTQTGEDSFRELYSRFQYIPIVIYTAKDSTRLAMDLVSRGAQDYVVKGKSEGRLQFALVHAIDRQKLVNDLTLKERKARTAVMVKSSFFSNMSHEIRNPLTSIIGYAEMLVHSKVDAEVSNKALQSIFTNGQYLLKLISDILDLSKIDAGELTIDPTEESLPSFIRDLKQAFVQIAENKDIDFIVEFNLPTPTRFVTDYFRLKQVLYNLIGNAIKFTNKGFVKLIIDVNQDDETLAFIVKDSGVGVPEDAKKRLFKSFSQGVEDRAKNFGGTGLGLVISKELIERLDGSISFTSRVGIGSVFTVTLPLGQAAMKSLTDIPPELEEKGRQRHVIGSLELSGRVLIADDLEDNRALLSMLLQNVGLETAVAANGSEVLEQVASTAFDLILLDMQMPVMSGYEAAKALRAQECTAPIVAVTGMMYTESLDECLAAGCDACLPKPFSQQELFDCVLKFLGASNADSNSGSDTAVQAAPKNDMLGKVRRNFVRGLETRIDDLQAALEANDLEQLKFEAHKLIGAGVFGFQDLSHLGGTLESLIIQEQVGGLGLVEALVNKVKTEYSKITLEDLCSSQSDNKECSTPLLSDSTVIVLDDDEVNLRTVARVLSVEGFSVAPARTQEQALDLCKDTSVSLLIVALETEGVENFSLIPNIRSKLERSIPVIAMTNRLPSEVRSQLAEIAVTHLLMKPVSRDSLLSAIDTLTAESIKGATLPDGSADTVCKVF